MEFLIDQKFWNKVIKKVSPKLAVFIKERLKMPDIYARALQKDVALTLPSKRIHYGFCAKFFVSSRVMREDWEKDIQTKKVDKNILELEKAILEVLIETQGLPYKVIYFIFGKGQYIIDQVMNYEIVKKGFVYLIRNEDIFKIGITDNLLRRFNQLKPDEVLNVVRCSNYESLEKDLHKKFKEYRIPQTEYFRLNKNQLEQVNIEMTKGADF